MPPEPVAEIGIVSSLTVPNSWRGAMAELDELALGLVIGFSGAVPSGVRVHPDRRHILYALGNTIVVHDLENAKNQTFLHGHSDRVTAVAVSPSGRFVASGQATHHGFQADIILWDFETRTALRRLRLHKGKVQDLSFSANDSYLLSLGGPDDNAVVVWDVESGQPIAGSPAANDPAIVVKWFNQGEVQFVTAGAYSLRVWEFDVGNRKIRPTDCQLGQLKRTVLSVAIDEYDEWLYCGTASGDVLKVSLRHALFKASGPTKLRFPQGVTAILLTPSGDIVAGGGNGQLAVLESGTFRVLRKAQVLGGVTTMTLLGDNASILLGTDQSNMYRVSFADLTADLLGSCHFQRINDVCFAFGYSKLFITASVGELRVWNSATGAELLRVAVPGVECLCTRVSQDGRLILSGWSDGKVRAFTPETGKLKWAIHDAHVKGVTALALSPDGSRLVTGGVEGLVRVWRVGPESQTMLTSMKEHKNAVTNLTMFKDGNSCASSSADGSSVIWDITRFVRDKAMYSSAVVTGTVLHPDESQLVTCTADRKVTFWDASDGTAIRELEVAETGEINAIDIDPSGEFFVVGGSDALVRLFSYDQGECIFVGHGHSSSIQKVKFSPDSQYIISVSDEGAVFKWANPVASQ